MVLALSRGLETAPSHPDGPRRTPASMNGPASAVPLRAGESKRPMSRDRLCGQHAGCRAIAESAPVDWVLIVFVLFKGLVFVTGMVLAIKWHYDREKQWADRRVLLRTAAQLAGVFVLLLLVVLGFTFGLARMLGMDLSLP